MPTPIEYKIAKCFGLLLGKTVRPSDIIEKETETAWNSLKHIEIIMTIEDATGVSFAPEEIPSLTSMARILAKVRELNAG